MMFSTKAEYGVRVMAHLAARGGHAPISLASVAEAEGLPLAYLEHLAARLRRAELIESRRGAQGGYTLARPAQEITMAEVVRALEGDIAPIDCMTAEADGSMTCVREGEAGHDPCPTKLLWTRVQSSIVRTLTEMTLADLARPVEAGQRNSKRGAGSPAEAGPAQPGRAREAGRRKVNSKRGAGSPAEVGAAEPGRSREAGRRKVNSKRGAGSPAEVSTL